MTYPYTTERGEKLATFRDVVEDAADAFPDDWRSGPANNGLYAAIVRGVVRGDIPTPVE